MSNGSLVRGDVNAFGRIPPKWFYTREQLEKKSPSRAQGISYEKECEKLQEASAFIRTIADRIVLNPVRNEKIPNAFVSMAIVRMRRFFLIHDLNHFDPYVCFCLD
jgi:hypothetical protein